MWARAGLRRCGAELATISVGSGSQSTFTKFCRIGRGAQLGAGARCTSVVRAFVHGAMGRRIDHWVDPLSYFSFHPVLHDWCNKSRGMYCPVCGMVHIKEPLLLIGKGCPCGGSGYFSHYLSGPLPYVQRHITVQ